MLYAFAGGFADASSFVLYRTFTGHVTGNLILLILSVVAKSWHDAAVRSLAIASFLACTSLGFRLATIRPKSIWLFCCQAALLIPMSAFQILKGSSPLLGVAALCCSLGLQNGIVTSSLGVSVHSTFVSGDFTALLRLPNEPRPASVEDRAARKRKARVLVLLLVAFASGALCAALLAQAYRRWLPLFLLIPLLAATLVQSMPVSTVRPHEDA